MDRDDTIAFVLVLAVGGLLAWYLLRSTSSTSVPLTTKGAGCSGAEGVIAAGGTVAAGTKGVKTDPNQICAGIRAVEEGLRQSAVAIVSSGATKPLQNAAQAVFGAGDTRPFAQRSCADLKSECPPATNWGGYRGTCAEYNRRCLSPGETPLKTGAI